MTAVILEGTLRPDGTIELDRKPSLLPGRVQVVLQPLAINPEARAALPVGNGSQPLVPAYPSADFYEPVEFAWSEASYQVRQALKEYSEGTHADHSDAPR